MSERIDLLIIDPQNDFCDKNGSLYVPGADEDMKRIAEMIDRSGKTFSNMNVTLDCHHIYYIAGRKFWRNSDGYNPDPFTIITHEDVVDGKWFPIFSTLPGVGNAREYVKEYTKKLEEGGRYPLCVWPDHCLISSWGGSCYPVLFDALIRWEENNHNNVNFVSKGSSITTEHYSGLQAEIPSPYEPETQLNTDLIKRIELVDKLLIGGEASSHCVKSTVEDIANNFSDSSYIKKLYFLEDGSSSVISPFVDFPAIAEKFVTDMSARGMQVVKTTDY